jgi:hypothetical protein
MSQRMLTLRLVLAASMLLTAPVRAQLAQGELRGVATIETGGVMPGVSISSERFHASVVRDTYLSFAKTSSEGLYRSLDENRCGQSRREIGTSGASDVRVPRLAGGRPAAW